MSTAPNVTVIPAKVQTAESRDKYHQLRVAAYCRVSTNWRNSRTAIRFRLHITPILLTKKNGRLQEFLQTKEFLALRQKKYRV